MTHTTIVLFKRKVCKWGLIYANNLCVFVLYCVFLTGTRVGWCGGGEKSVCVFVCVSVINHKGKTAIINHSQL